MKALEFIKNDIVVEAAMNPSEYSKAIETGHDQGVLVGFEFEVCVPFDSEPDYRTIAEYVAHNIKNVFGDPIIFDSYHQREKNLINWYIEPDGSIKPEEGDGAVEVVSPPMPAKEAIDALKQFYAFAKTMKLYTSRQNGTGLHINVSIPKNIDAIKLAVFLGDEYVLRLFGREKDSYAGSVMKLLKHAVNDHPTHYVKNKTVDTRIIKFVAEKFVSNHTASINVTDNYVSFRHVGADYLNKPEDVLNVLGRFVRAMIIASDPNAYKNEYLTKISKLFNNTIPIKPINYNTITKQKLIELYKTMKYKGLPYIVSDMIYDKNWQQDTIVDVIHRDLSIYFKTAFNWSECFNFFIDDNCKPETLAEFNKDHPELAGIKLKQFQSVCTPTVTSGVTLKVADFVNTVEKHKEKFSSPIDHINTNKYYIKSYLMYLPKDHARVIRATKIVYEQIKEFGKQK